MITDLMDTSDPLQGHIRQSAMSFMNHIFAALSGNAHEQRTALVHTLFALEHTRSLLAIAQRMNLISEMNYHIIHRELYLLQVNLDRELDTPSHESEHTPIHRHERSSVQEFFEKEFSTLPEFTAHREREFIPTSAQVQQQVKDTNPAPSTPKMSAPVRPTHAPKATPAPATPRSIKDIAPTAKPQRGENAKRRDIIISIIKEKNNVTMKDIATRITNCTEKTLQRDLMSLIEEGIIEKKGKRRWSSYSYKK
ncbi:MAG: helix-turn-helix domain-containing protein [Candidatus Pacebacteria bacterium]|nr:helix-turn-helix domain-containing protein [Candidatus Paceibacterota bacterium]